MAEDNLLNKRIPELAEARRKLRADDMFVFYDSALDKTMSMRGSNMVPRLLGEGEYVVLHYPEDTSEANPLYIGDSRVLVIKGDKIFKLVHQTRPYGSTNLEDELALGHWEQVGGKTDEDAWVFAQDAAAIVIDYNESPNQNIALSPTATVASVEVINIPDGKDLRLNFLNCDGRSINLAGAIENTDFRARSLGQMVLPGDGNCYWLVNHSRKLDENNAEVSYLSWTQIDDSEGAGTWSAAERVTHAQMVEKAAASALESGKFYIYDYYPVYRYPHNNQIVAKTTEIETLIVQAADENSFTGEAISVLYPQDKIKLDALNVTDGAVGVITERIDSKGNRAGFDWRGITVKRYNVTGLKYIAGTKTTEDLLEATVTGSFYTNRYFEFYATLPTVHNAGVSLKVTKGASTLQKQLATSNGTVLGANAIGGYTATGKVLVYYSVVHDKFVIAVAEWEDAAIQGYLSEKSSSLQSRGNATNIIINPIGAPDVYIFGDKDASLCERCIIEDSGINNVVINPVGYAKDIRVRRGSLDSTIQTYYTAFLDTTGPIKNSILKGNLSGSVFATGGLDNAFIIIKEGGGWGLPYKIQPYTSVKAQAAFLNVTCLHPSPAHVFGLQYKNLANTTIRSALYGAGDGASCNISLGDCDSSFFNCIGGVDQVYWEKAYYKAYEYGFNRSYSVHFGRDLTPKSFGDVRNNEFIVQNQDVFIEKAPEAGTTAMSALVWDSALGKIKKTAFPASGGGVVSTGSPDTVTNIWKGTQVQYDAIATKDAATLYFIKA